MEIIEVGPRDGLQNEQRVLSTEEKVTYIELLVDAGIKRMEAVSFARLDRVPQMADAEAVMARVPRRDSVSYIGLVMNERGLERAIDAGVDEVNLVILATETFSQRNQGMSISESLRGTEKMVERAVEGGLCVSVTIGASFGCPFEGDVSTRQVMDIVTAVDRLDIDEIALADTIGVGTPPQVRRLLGAAKEISQRSLRLHLHNTRNTGYANAFAAFEAGAKSLDSSRGVSAAARSLPMPLAISRPRTSHTYWNAVARRSDSISMHSLTPQATSPTSWESPLRHCLDERVGFRQTNPLLGHATRTSAGPVQRFLPMSRSTPQSPGCAP